MGSKRRKADAFTWLAEGLAARGHPAHTPDHVRSKVKELQQGYAQARDAASRSGAAPVTCPFYRELREILGPQHTSSLPATLDTSADEPQQAPEAESTLEASPATQGPSPRSPPLGHRRRRRGDPPPAMRGSRSPSRPGAPAGRLPTGCPLTVGVDHQLHHRRVRRAPERCQWSWRAHRGHHCRPAPQRSTNQPQGGADGGPSTTHGRRRTPQLLATLRRQLEVSEQRLWVDERRLQLREQALAWRQEAWGAFMCTFERIVDYLDPPCRASCLSAHPACSTRRSTRCSPRRPPPRGLLLRGTWGLLTPASHICWFARPPASLGQG
ncbi:uncharacterized protein LOC142007398 [Carettochelys insculpta]|uniref:uncharacterized protein LOC142007398 n=1 Tax=Carettochelys insculpta TaxID=44489 RepID=UPI003EBB37DA